MPQNYLLIKPASSRCDLHCDYCFYRDVAAHRAGQTTGFMSEAVLEAVIRRGLTESDGTCTFAFQGGEPTLVGLDFYKKALALEAKYNRKGLRVNHLIQTNGCTLDDAWAEFFAAHNFLVGVSLDGPRDVHDFARKTSLGEGSYRRVMAGIEALKAHGVDFNILTVVTGQTAKHIGKIYRFFKRQGFSYLQFIPCIPAFGREGEKTPYALTGAEYGQFLCTLFDLWAADAEKGGAPHIRQFENYIEMLLGYPPESCGMSGVCAGQLVVEWDGGTYPCDFYVLDRYLLGNVTDTSLKEMAESAGAREFLSTPKAPHPDCQACRFFPLCRGGCKRYREPVVHGDYGFNFLCEGYRAFFEQELGRLMAFAGRLQNGAPPAP